MDFRNISAHIPEFYHRLLPEIFTYPIPPEPFSDCMNCPLICEDDSQLNHNSSKPFSPETKCCTFSPRIPNYMAGAVLSDNSPDNAYGREIMLNIIASRKGIFPNGVYPTKKYRLLYESSRNDSFGRSKVLLCPYFRKGKFNCSIWKYREAICALWFCKHLAGTAGYDFWNTIIEYMKYVQESLIAYCFAQLGFENTDPYGEDNNISFEDLEDLPMKKQSYDIMWGEWAGKETEFYIHCYKLINQMSKETFDAIVGIDQAALLQKISAAYACVTELPEKMICLHKQSLPRKDENYIIEINHYIERIDSTIAYSFMLPVYVIDSFDGTLTTPQVVEKIYNEKAVTLEPGILIALYQHGVLSAC